MEMVIQNRRQDAGLSSGASMASFPAQLTMTSFIHALNIGTLATWLSVAGFGAMGVLAMAIRARGHAARAGPS